MLLQGKKILLGVGGSISAYKVPELIRLLRQEGAEVQVMMTRSSRKFVAPLTLATLSGKKVFSDLFEQGEEMQHIHATRDADVMLIAPATANMLAQFSYGMAHDLLTATVLASSVPVLIAPAMNVRMWEHFLVKDNYQRLLKAGYHFVYPGTGNLACGEVGEGRLASVVTILFETVKMTRVQDLSGKKVLITAGSTREFIDPVRFISNSSSGKMALSLIREAYYRGADVTVVAGIALGDLPDGIKVYKVKTALEMQKVVTEFVGIMDVFISAAAVADYRPQKMLAQKLSGRAKKGSFLLPLVLNPDILKSIAKKSVLAKKTLMVGFALETDAHIKNAGIKFREKKLDILVLNDVSALDQDEAEVWFLDHNKVEKLEKMSKTTIAKMLFSKIVKFL